MRLIRLFLIVTVLSGAVRAAAVAGKADSIAGAWQIAGEVERVMIVTPSYWTQTIYDREGQRFVRTFGGTYALNGERAAGRIEFDSEDRERVGEPFQVRARRVGEQLIVAQEDGTEEVWTRIDAAESPLAGTWRISGRQVEGAFREMPLRARRTLKIFSGTRFQWVAFDVDTGEFSGTGGGVYRFGNGKYTEQLEFFSRDGSRVGARLEFEAEVEGDRWRHRGRGSRGDPIDEVWTRFEPAGEDAGEAKQN